MSSHIHISLVLLTLIPFQVLTAKSNSQEEQFSNFPIQSAQPYGASRFGEMRAGYGHQGLDISTPLGHQQKLVAIDDSIVVATGNTGSKSGLGTVLQPVKNKDVVAVYWHQWATTPNIKVGNNIRAGEHIGYAGGTSQPIAHGSEPYPIHLHFGIGVKAQNNSLNIWLGKGSNESSVIHNTSMTAGRGAQTPIYKGTSYYWANPAPFLPQDMIIRPTGGVDPLRKYLGNSIRTQYNALVGNPNALPIQSPAQMGSDWMKLPRLNIKYSGVPSSVATENAQMAVVNAIGTSDEAEKNITSNATLSPDQLAMYMPTRSFFSGESTVNVDIGDGNISEAELIEKIGFSRFGNSEYQRELVSTSLRGMLTDYLNIINAKAYIKKAMYLQRERIEALYAALATQTAKYNLNGDLEKTIEKAQNPSTIPEISQVSLAEVYDAYDQGTVPSDAQLVNAIGSDFSEANKLKNTSCSPLALNGWRRLSYDEKRQIVLLALKLGFDPNDLAIAMSVETINFNTSISNLYNTKKKYGDKWLIAAAGFVQLTPSGMANERLWQDISTHYPEMNSISKKVFGTSTPSFSQIKKTPPADYLLLARTSAIKSEFKFYEAYFASKGIFSKNVESKGLYPLYVSIFGSGEYVQGTDAYNANKHADINNDGRVSAKEMLLTSGFRDRYCQYISDNDIINNTYNLTDDDLKIPAWKGGVKFQPKLSNLGGYFSFRKSIEQRKSKSE